MIQICIFGKLLLIEKQKVLLILLPIQKLRNCRWYGNNDVSRWRILLS
jgi:hypothetical protein